MLRNFIRMECEKIDREFQKFNKAYKEKLDQVMNDNKDMDLFDQVDLALKKVKEDDARRNV